MKIDELALEETKQACHIELDKIQNKYNTNHIQLLWLYMIKEFKNQMMIAFIGLIAVCFVSYHIQYATLLCVIVYFLLLGSMAIVEHIKNEIYDMKELMNLSYMNEGRSFLYKSIIMALLQLVMFLSIYFIVPMSSTTLIKAILYALLPIYLTQIICVYFMKYLSNVFTTLIVYFVFYMVIVLIMEYIKIINYVTMSLCMWILLGVIVVYIVNTCFVYKKKKVGDLVWNLY